MRRDKYEDERGSGGNGGSSWISYSDMMASLLLVFVLMLCVSLLKYFTAPKEEDLRQQQSIEEQLKEIEMREADLAKREEKLAKALAELEKERAELQKAQEQLAKDQTELRKTQEQLAKDQAELQKAQEQLERDQAELRKAQEQLEKDQAELLKAQEQLEKDQAELQKAQEQLENDQAELQKAQEQLENGQAELQKAQEQLEKNQAELQKAQEQLAKDQAELQKAQEQLAKDRTALAQQKKDQSELQKTQEQLSKDRAELQAAQEQLAKDQAALAQLEKAQAELQEAQEQLAKDQAALQAAQERLQKDQQALEQEKKELEEARAALAQDRILLEEELATLETEKEQLKKEQAELTEAQDQLRLEREAFLAEKEAEAAPTPEPESEWQREIQREIEKQQAILDQYSLRSLIIASQYSVFENSGLNITINQDTGNITMPNFILFDAGSSELSDEGKQFLDTFIPLYLEVLMRPEYESDISEVIIEGHTDSFFSTSMELSQQRALRVMAYSMQMPALTEAQRAYLTDRATFIGRGFTDPVFDKDGQVNREASRRVEIKFQIRDSHLLAETDLVGELTSRLNEAGIPASVNPETGDVLPEGILFFKAGEDTLTEEGKTFIREFLPVYLEVLMKPGYQKQVGMLIIEGTADRLVPDADHLELSQRRTVHVMEYYMQLDLTEEQLAYLQKTLATAGRMAADSADGTGGQTEDNAGAQVTFRFRLKNADSLTELRNLLQDN
jgi:outer membrane protein OmpA-like peptidoglycan-associated protein